MAGLIFVAMGVVLRDYLSGFRVMFMLVFMGMDMGFVPMAVFMVMDKLLML